jgi:hypothetical protein
MQATTTEQDDIELRHALDLIKLHITVDSRINNAERRRNIELHAAVQIIVTVARRHGLLLEHGGR